jgi:ABC-type bacteriocin/lantibiotic exporter with double-glycine peptidase domain
LEIRAGSIVAIVGPSGAGKSTLTDLILGLLTPKSGSVSISGYEPSKAIAKWPGQIAYVPQEVRIFDGSLAENITQGYSPEEIMGFDLMDTLQDSALTELFRTSLDGFAVELGTKGARLSGGQIQRVGIARALLTKPKLIVFDEATSALDADTESIITETLAKLRGNTTVVIVAHRLSTVLNADSVIYLQEGQIVAEGSFGEVRAKVPDFDRQAQLMGLISKNLS